MLLEQHPTAALLSAARPLPPRSAPGVIVLSIEPLVEALPRQVCRDFCFLGGVRTYTVRGTCLHRADMAAEKCPLFQDRDGRFPETGRTRPQA